MAFDNDFCYLSPFLLLPFFRREEKKGKSITKVVLKSHAFLLNQVDNTPQISNKFSLNRTFHDGMKLPCFIVVTYKLHYLNYKIQTNIHNSILPCKLESQKK